MLALTAITTSFCSTAAPIVLTGVPLSSAWDAACTVSSGVTTPSVCTMKPLEQLIKVYKVAVCTSKPGAPTASSASTLPDGCSTLYESSVGQVTNFSSTSTLANSVKPANGTYKYLYVEIDPEFRTKGYVELPTNSIAAIVVTNSGMGYDAASVSFSGGTCTTPPEAIGIVPRPGETAAGTVGDIHLQNPGVCSEQPTTATINTLLTTPTNVATAQIIYGGLAKTASGSLRVKYNGVEYLASYGRYCWTSGGSQDIIYDWRANFSNPWEQPSYMTCGDALPSQEGMGYSTIRFNGFSSGANFSIINAPVSNGVASGSAATLNGMDVFLVNSAGTLPTGGSFDNANGITKVIGIIAIGGGASGLGVTYNGTGTPTLSFNNSRGAKLENGGTVYPGLIYRLGTGPLDATFTVE